MSDLQRLLDAITGVARATPGLELLILYGSRARGDETSHSDWDFGYLAATALDSAALLGALVTALDSDRIDLADLARASGLLLFRAARDGKVVFEARAGAADHFRLEAAQFWCDVAPLLKHGYDHVLAELKG